MRRSIILLALALGLSVWATPAAAGPRWFAGGALHYTVANGAPSNATIAFSATSDSTGGNPRGYIVFENFVGTQDVEAVLTCLEVDGSNAQVVGEITRSDVPTAPPGDDVHMYVTDYGNPGQGGAGVDAQISSAGGTFSCTGPLTVPPHPPILYEFTGNFVVRDA